MRTGFIQICLCFWIFQFLQYKNASAPGLFQFGFLFQLINSSICQSLFFNSTNILKLERCRLWPEDHLYFMLLHRGFIWIGFILHFINILINILKDACCGQRIICISCFCTAGICCPGSQLWITFTGIQFNWVSETPICHMMRIQI